MFCINGFSDKDDINAKTKYYEWRKIMDNDKKNKNELITIIVPVYNVEDYLCKCIDSIIGQTYNNLEIILVDDGSPDRCGEICDEYARHDTRIRVIHKENGGLSDARNVGIENSKGDYIAFVDSDDYIAPDMYEKLYNIAKVNDADMSICSFMCVNTKGNSIDDQNLYNPISNNVLSGIEVFEDKLAENQYWYWVVAWNKLYRRSLFDNIRFPVGKQHEDEFVAHHLYSITRKVACCGNKMYYYVKRENSIMSKKYTYKGLDACEAFLDRAKMGLKYNLNPNAITFFLNQFCDVIFSSYDKSDKKDELVKQRRKALMGQYRRLYCSLNSVRFRIKQNIKFILMSISPYVLYKGIKMKAIIELFVARRGSVCSEYNSCM